MAKLKCIWEEKNEHLAEFVNDLLEMARECFRRGNGETTFEGWRKRRNEDYNKYRSSYWDCSSEIYEKIVSSICVSARGVPGELKDRDKIRKTLFNYRPEKVVSASPEALLENLFSSERLKDESKRRYRKKFVKGFREAAIFVLEPPNDDFWQFVDRFNRGVALRWTLAKILGSKIARLGPVLACNFFIALGVPEFSKPDASTKSLLRETGLLPPNVADDYLAFWSVQEIARRTNEKPLTIDKIIWMLRSELAQRDGWVNEEKRNQWIAIYIRKWAQ